MRQLWDLIPFMVVGDFALKAPRCQALRSPLERKIQGCIRGDISLGIFIVLVD